MTVTGTLRTKELAEAVQISVQQVRNYEAEGFLPPVERSTAGYRQYTHQHLVALQTTRLLIASYGWQKAQRIMQAVHSGRPADALALIDSHHADLDRTRRHLEESLATLTVLAAQLPAPKPTRLSQKLRVRAAADRVGVPISTLRFWEQQGLLHPRRDPTSNYRLYDERELRRLDIVALLRQAHYDFPAIRTALAELEAGQPQKALAAVEQRRDDLARRSWHCVQAMALFYSYVSDYHEPPT